MGKPFLAIIIAILLSVAAFAQNSISRFVVASAGNTEEQVGNMVISYTVGEPIVGTFFVNDIYTQGFQQPDENTTKPTVYNGITPNGDGLNDSWYIQGIKKKNSVVIFNRWGDIVWKADNYDNTKVVWSGTNQNGKALPDATYFYVISSGGKKYKGWVNVSR